MTDRGPEAPQPFPNGLAMSADERFLFVAQSHTDDVLQVEEGSLYPALQRLAIKGLVKAEWNESETGRKARYYKLTAAGRKQAVQEVAGFEKLSEAILRVVQPA